MDGVGEWATTSAAMGDGNRLEILKEIHFPHSLGLLYSAFTYYTGFKVNSGEYKVMGLAPYGEPKYAQIFDHLIDLKPDGSFRLDMSYFDYCTGLTMTNERFAALFGEPVRAPDQPLTNFHMDVAASTQAVLNEVVLRLTRGLAKKTGAKNLCLAGGVALSAAADVLDDLHQLRAHRGVRCFETWCAPPGRGHSHRSRILDGSSCKGGYDCGSIGAVSALSSASMQATQGSRSCSRRN